MPRALALVLPFIVWLGLHRHFLNGNLPLNLDTNTIYAVTKFYFNNLLNGVVPLWDPFVSLGRPFYALPICNLFNPFTQLVAILKVLGLDYRAAFTCYMVVYFFVGCLGFYGLALRLLNDRKAAFLAYLGLMFSSLGTSMFTQLTFVEMLVPAIWFFYFLIGFEQKPSAGHFLGMALCVMMILSAYLPFYFFTVLCVFGIWTAVLYGSDFWNFWRNLVRFMFGHRLLTLLTLVGLIAAAGPLLAYKALDASGEMVSPGRHCQYTSLEECRSRTLNEQGNMSYKEITQSGGLGERLDVGFLFSHLDKLTYGSDSLFFVPLWVYVILALASLLRLDRWTIVAVLMIVTIGLIALGKSAPLHRFLYDHIFFFQYFRNLFFLGAFLVPLVILLAAKQWVHLVQLLPSTGSRRKLYVVGLVLAHVAMAVFLRTYDAQPIAYVSLGLSAGFFILCSLKLWARPAFVLATLVMVLQPISVMVSLAANAQEFTCVLPSQHVRPQFSWVRPDQPATSSCRIYQFVPYEDFWYAMSMTDAPAKVGFPVISSRHTFETAQQVGEQLSNYAKFKVYLFDENGGQAVTGPRPELTVKDFQVNRIIFKTNFDRPRLLVYNDSFTRHWKAQVDGRPTPLERTNGAFKGVQVPHGPHDVQFTYQPPGGQWVYLGTTLVLLVFLVWTAVLLWRERA